MGRLLALGLLGVVAGAGIAAYNAVRYEVLQPIPLSWNHSPDEMALLALERERRTLAAKLRSGERTLSLAGVPLATASEDDTLRADLAALDRQIETLQARIRGRPPATR